MAGDSDNRSTAIQGFVHRLEQVRTDAGKPSFREMAKRSGAISHATLHDALQGARMPSWETTVEFARACGADPEELRGDWEAAVAVVRPTDECLEASDEPEPGPPRRRPRRQQLLVGLAVAVAMVGALVAAFVLTREDPDDATAGSTVTGEATAAYSSAPSAPSTTTGPDGCPGNVDVSAGSKTLVDGDGAAFVDDVTIPDCSTQPRGEAIVKTWELKNSGAVEWEGRYLHRINVHEGSQGCRAPERVAIPDTSPGETVEVSVTIATPDRKATCFGRWMQTDSDGNFTFPQQRPYYYTFKVE